MASNEVTKTVSKGAEESAASTSKLSQAAAKKMFGVMRDGNVSASEFVEAQNILAEYGFNTQEIASSLMGLIEKSMENVSGDMARKLSSELKSIFEKPTMDAYNDDGGLSDRALEEIVRIVKESKDVEQSQKDILDNLLKEQQDSRTAFLTKMDGLANGMKDSIEGLNGTMKGMVGVFNSITKGDAKGIVSGVDSTISGISDAIGSLAPEGSASAEAILSKLKVAGGWLAALGAGVAALDTIGSGIDSYGNLRDISLNQTGNVDLGIGAGMNLQSAWTQYTTNMSAQDVSTVQKELLKSRALYGTQEYNQGIEFATIATQQYGISAATASKLYTDAVVKGTMSMSELNGVMNDLRETVRNSNMTMDEAIEDFQSSIATLKSSMAGGNDSYATELNADIQSVVSDTDELNVVSAMASRIGTNNPQFMNDVAAYQEQYGTTYAAAVSAVSLKYTQEGYGMSGDSPLFWLIEEPMNAAGDKFWDIFNSGDRDKMLSAITELNRNQAGFGNRKLNWATFVSAMNALGVDKQAQNDPEQLTDFLMGTRKYDKDKKITDMGLFGTMGRMSSAGSIANGSSSGFTGSLGNDNLDYYLQEAIEKGYISSSQASNLTEEQAVAIASYGESLSAYGGAFDYAGSMERYIDSIVSSENAAAKAAQASQNGTSVTIRLKDGAEKIFTAIVEGQQNQNSMDAGAN